MLINDKKIMECVNIEGTNGNQIILNVDGERILKQVYDDNKITMEESNEAIRLYSGSFLFIEILTNKVVFKKEECKQIAITLRDRLNNTMKHSLGIKEDEE